MLKKIYYIILYALFLCTSNFILAQNSKVTISGTIKDNQSRGKIGVILYMRSSLDMISWIENKAITDSNGFYQFESLGPGMTHYITPQKQGFSFNPSTAKIENLNQNKVQDFTISVISVKIYSISGSVKDKNLNPIEGVTMLLNGKLLYGEEVSQTATTDANGFYKFERLDSAAHYYITPSKEKYVFSPSIQIFDILNENKTQDFTGIAVISSELSISGYIKDKNSIPIMGVDISLIGPPYDSRMRIVAPTDSNGFYKIEKLEAGKNYSIVPLKDGYLFDPVFKTFDILDDNKRQDFIAIIDTTPRYTISGYVRDKNSQGISNVAMRLYGILLSSVSLITTTDNSGYYQFKNLRPKIGYYLSAFKQGYTFNPSGVPFDSLKENKTQDFIGNQLPNNLSISGYVKDNNSQPIESATIYISGLNSMDLKTATDATGFYKLEGIMGGQNVKMFISKYQYVFDPPSVSFENILENKSQNFIGRKIPVYSINGYVTDQNGIGILGVTMVLNGGKYDKLLTDSSGFYKFDGLEEGKSYNITLTRRGYNFNLQSITFENLHENKNQNFTGTKIPTANYSISGYVKDKNSIGLEGVTLSLTSEELFTGVMDIIKEQIVVKTNSSGFYKFENIESGRSYILNAEKTGYSFIPKYAIFDNLNGNKTQDFVGNPVTFSTVSGYIKDKDSKAIIGVTIIVGGEVQMKTITDSNGFYKLENLESGKSYSILPFKRGFDFEPRYNLIENLNVNKQIDFIGSPTLNNTFPICGFIEDKNNTRLGNVTVILTGDKEGSTQTDENGFFKFENMEEGKNYIITPFKEGYNFYPPSINLNNLVDAKALNTVGDRLFVTNVNQNRDYLKKEITLHSNYPNPFNPSTTIEYELTNPCEVKLKVFDMLGKEIYTIFEGYQNAGLFRYQFDARNISSGKYYVRLQAGNIVKSISITLLK